MWVVFGAYARISREKGFKRAKPRMGTSIMLRALMYLEAGLLKRVRTAGFGVSTRMEP